MIGHSLGGLVIKQALVDAAVAVSSPAHKDLYESFIGALFFGVPNRGLNDKFLHEIVRGQPNQYLIQSLDPESSELRRLHEGFTTIFDKTKYKFYSYYETRVTALSEINPTTGRLEETNKTAILVLQHSATECVPNQARHDHIPVDADHRGINKFATRSNHNFLQVRSHILALVSVAQEKVDRQALQKAPDFSSHDGHPVRFAVPYMENEKYTRRVKLDDMLSKLSEAEHAVVLVGPGGTGKTQAALKLAFQSRHARDVYWIDGSTIESFTSGVILVGKYLGLAKAGMKESDLCEEVKKWLESDESGKWLAVIDNLTHTDQSALDVFSAEKGTLVVTTRQEDFSRMLRARQLDYANMTAEEARMAFHNLSSIDIDDRTVDGSDIVKLLSLLDHFPLAVSLAASFIRETKTPVAEYLEMLQRSLPDYIKLSQDQTLRFELKDPPTATVIAAWDISFRRIKRDKPSAASLLQLMSMLDAHDIPVDLLHFKPTTEIGCEKGSKFDGAIAVLQSFSLVSTYKEHKYHIHDVVAAWTRKQMGDKSEHFAQLALSLIEEAISDQNSPKLVDYLPHGDAVLLHTTKFTKLVQRRMVFQSKLAGILCQAGRHSKAIELIKDCIEYYEATKKDGLENAECSYQLALIEETQKNYGEAITWHLKAKDGFVQNLGQSHLRTLGALTHLASVSELRGDYLNALQNYEQALAWAKTAPKPSDSFLIDTIHSIALVYDGQGRYPQALEFFDRALSGSIQTVGAAHPNTLAIQNNRAISLRKQGLYSDALSAFKEVAAGYAQLLGSAHPAALNVAGNIALIDDIQGRHTLALQAYTHILSQKEAHPALGEDSLSALATRANLALLQSKLARHDDAVTSARRVLEGYTATLGPDHPSTLDAVANLALILDAAGDVQAAKSHYAHACWRQAMQLGLSHPATLATLSNFAAFSARLGVWAEAVELQDQVLSGYREAFGDAHVFTLRAERELARFLGGCGRWEEALGVLERLAAGYKAERKGEGKGKSEEYEAVKREIKDVKAKMEEAVAAGGSAAWRG